MRVPPASSAGGSSRSGVLLLGAVFSGAFAAAAMWLAGRDLGLVAFEALAQLWTLWGLVAIGLAFAFQQWEVSRSLELSASRRRRMPSGVRLGLLVGGVVVLLLTNLFRVRIFGSASLAWPLAAATLPIGTALTGMAYATFARAGRLRALAVVMASENATRLLLTFVLASVDAPSVAFSFTIPAGFLVSLVPLLVTPVAKKQDSGLAAGSARQLPTYALIGSATNLLVFGGPLLLGAAGGQAEVVSALFLVLIIPRAPFLLANALIPPLIVAGTASVVAGDVAVVRRWILMLAGAGCGLAMLGGPLAYAIADPIAAALFHAGGVLDPLTYGLLGVSAALVLTTTMTNPLMIAMGRLNAVALAWGMVVVSGVVLSGFGAISEPVLLTAWMSVCAAAVVAAQVTMALATKATLRT